MCPYPRAACIPSALTLCGCTRGEKGSPLGTALATTNDTALQPQGIGPDNPRADTKLTHSLVAFQDVGDSSEAFISSCSSCSSSFSCPSILPPVIRHGKQAKHP